MTSRIYLGHQVHDLGADHGMGHTLEFILTVICDVNWATMMANYERWEFVFIVYSRAALHWADTCQPRTIHLGLTMHPRR